MRRRTSPRYAAAVFATTRWSIVRAAAGSDPITQRAALRELCEIYWQPLYVWLRQDGHAPDDAEDLAQGFVAELLTKGSVSGQVAGRFRSYLLGALRHYVANQRRHERTQQRGGDRMPIADRERAEQLLRDAIGREALPDQAFARACALATIDRALLRLEREQGADPVRWAVLRRHLDGCTEADQGYAGSAAELGLATGALRVAVHRARQRLGELLRADLAQGVSDPAELESELQELLAALAT
jgi:DNA-directed RNA polymerase specialized sigma24 family protein